MSWNPFSSTLSSNVEDPPSDQESSSSPSTLAERRAAALPLRATTRSTSSSSPSRHHLSAQELVRRIYRSRSPSPNHLPTNQSTFVFPTTTMSGIDEDVMARIVANAVKMALTEDRAERDRQSALHTEAAVAAALANQSNQVRALRKPDLPPLDKKYIEQWIARVEYAYTRTGVDKAKDKFAFLESKFSGCEDAKMNELLRGSTNADWDSFLSYLRDIYGRTKEDKVAALLGGFPRESRRPQQLAAHIRDRVGDITLDDVFKQTLLKEIPPEVRQHAATAIKDLDFQETADHLEIYFDKQGKVLNSNKSSTSINSVGQKQQPHQQRLSRPLQSSLKSNSPSRNESATSTRSSEPPSFTNAFSDEEDASDVNAVRFRSNGQHLEPVAVPRPKPHQQRHRQQ